MNKTAISIIAALFMLLALIPSPALSLIHIYITVTVTEHIAMAGR